ncbi:hypothetical protein LTR28_004675 [Elasticomyces elasticus]|nr:hypothetical protein LTR28_004675 [Elasticomyces elasticus]
MGKMQDDKGNKFAHTRSTIYESAWSTPVSPSVTVESDALSSTSDCQSKLSPQELSELQKATHFDKKELQQWYKALAPPNPQPNLTTPKRFPTNANIPQAS